MYFNKLTFVSLISLASHIVAAPGAPSPRADLSFNPPKPFDNKSHKRNENWEKEKECEEYWKDGQSRRWDDHDKYKHCHKHHANRRWNHHSGPYGSPNNNNNNNYPNNNNNNDPNDPSNTSSQSEYTGNIEVYDFATNAPIGFISVLPNTYGEYTITNDASEYLEVAMPKLQNNRNVPRDTGIAYNIYATNGPYEKSYLYVGAIEGYASSSADLEPGSYNYAYIGGTKQTSRGSSKYPGNSFTATTGHRESSQSAIWNVDFDSLLMTPQWVNSDGSKPYVAAGILEDTLFLTGDLDAFENAFGDATQVYFVFAPGFNN